MISPVSSGPPLINEPVQGTSLGSTLGRVCSSAMKNIRAVGCICAGVWTYYISNPCGRRWEAGFGSETTEKVQTIFYGNQVNITSDAKVPQTPVSKQAKLLLDAYLKAFNLVIKDKSVEGSVIKDKPVEGSVEASLLVFFSLDKTEIEVLNESLAGVLGGTCRESNIFNTIDKAFGKDLLSDTRLYSKLGTMAINREVSTVKEEIKQYLAEKRGEVFKENGFSGVLEVEGMKFNTEQKPFGDYHRPSELKKGGWVNSPSSAAGKPHMQSININLVVETFTWGRSNVAPNVEPNVAHVVRGGCPCSHGIVKDLEKDFNSLEKILNITSPTGLEQFDYYKRWTVIQTGIEKSPLTDKPLEVYTKVNKAVQYSVDQMKQRVEAGLTTYPLEGGGLIGGKNKVHIHSEQNLLSPSYGWFGIGGKNPEKTMLIQAQIAAGIVQDKYQIVERKVVKKTEGQPVEGEQNKTVTLKIILKQASLNEWQDSLDGHQQGVNQLAYKGFKELEQVGDLDPIEILLDKGEKAEYGYEICKKFQCIENELEKAGYTVSRGVHCKSGKDRTGLWVIEQFIGRAGNEIKASEAEVEWIGVIETEQLKTEQLKTEQQVIRDWMRKEGALTNALVNIGDPHLAFNAYQNSYLRSLDAVFDVQATDRGSHKS